MHSNILFGNSINSEVEKIPHCIHFIWAGGSKLMPSPSRSSVIAWATENPTLTVYVWIDLLTTPVNLLKNYYKSSLEPNFLANDNIQLRDITTAQVLNYNNLEQWDSCVSLARQTFVSNESVLASPFVRYEIDRLRSNYGSSSDCLRYRILYTFGGGYFDSDINPGDIALTTLINRINAEKNLQEILLVGVNSQNENMPGNDAFLCSPHHPFMHEAFIEAESRYCVTHPLYHRLLTSSPDEVGFSFDNIKRPCFALESFAFYDVFYNIEEETLLKTGPLLIHELLKKQGIMDKCLKLNDNNMLPAQYYKPFEINTRFWIQSNIRRLNNYELALNIITETLQFEINTLKFLRFTDHVENIYESLGRQYSKPMIANSIMDLLQEGNINKNNILYVQCDLNYPMFLQYCASLPNLNFDIAEVKAIGDHIIPLLSRRIGSLEVEESDFVSYEELRFKGVQEFLTRFSGMLLGYCQIAQKRQEPLPNDFFIELHTLLKNFSLCYAFEEQTVTDLLSPLDRQALQNCLISLNDFLPVRNISRNCPTCTLS